MKRSRLSRGFGLLVATAVGFSLVATLGGAAAFAAKAIGVTWTNGVSSPFDATRFDGAYDSANKRIYFLGFRTDADATDGSIWYYDTVTQTYTDTGKDMPVPVSNYGIAALTDPHGLAFYIFGGRDANAAIVNTTQVYYPAAN